VIEGRLARPCPTVGYRADWSRSLTLRLLVWIAFFVAGAQPPTLIGQEAGAESPIVVRAFTFIHQPPEEALPLVYPLLTERGTVELQPAENTLVLRDEEGAIGRVLAVIRAFDHPVRSLDMQIRIVQAGQTPSTSGSGSDLPGEIEARLRTLLNFTHYQTLASATFRAREGQEADYEVGGRYSVGFRVGTVLADRRVRLHGFRVERGENEGEWRRLIHTTLSLRLNEPMILGLARAETSDSALMVVLTCRLQE